MGVIKVNDYVIVKYNGYSELHNIFNGKIGIVKEIYSSVEFKKKIKLAEVWFNHSYVNYKLTDLVITERPRRSIAETIKEK